MRSLFRVVALLGTASGFGLCPVDHAAFAENGPRVARLLAGPIAQVNERIDQKATPVAGLPATRGLGLTPDGRLALLDRPCESDACAIQRRDSGVILGFAPGEINTASVGYQPAGRGFAVIFTCTTIAPCITSPDGRLKFRGYGLPCADQTECNRLVIDFTALLNQAGVAIAQDEPRSEAEAAPSMTPAEALPRSSTVGERGCKGAGCNDLELKAQGGCVAAVYRGAKSARLDARLADQAVTLYLEAADAAKSEARAAALRDEEIATQLYLQAKDELRRSEEFLQQMRDQGVDTTEMERNDAWSRKPLGPDPREARRKREENGYHGRVWNPVAQRDDPVYVGTLRTKAGCVDQPESVLAWTIEFTEIPATTIAEEGANDAAADGGEPWPIDELKFGCKGNACGAVNTNDLRNSACEIGNRGKRPIMVIVRQKSGSQLKIPSLEPGEHTRLSTPMGCIDRSEIAEVEATYN